MKNEPKDLYRVEEYNRNGKTVFRVIGKGDKLSMAEAYLHPELDFYTEEDAEKAVTIAMSAFYSGGKAAKLKIQKVLGIVPH